MGRNAADLPVIEARSTLTGALAVGPVAVVLVVLAIGLVCKRPDLVLEGWWVLQRPAAERTLDDYGAIVDSLVFILLGIGALAFFGPLIALPLGWAWRWRGTRVGVSPDGFLIEGPSQARRYPWPQVTRVPLTYSVVEVITADGEAARVPLMAFSARIPSRDGASGAGCPGRVLPVLAHAYWEASRAQDDAALREPPRLVMGYRGVSRKGESAVGCTVLAGMLTGAIALFGGAMAEAFIEGRAIQTALVLTGFLALCGVIMWLMARRAGRAGGAATDRIHAGPDGLTVSAGRQRDVYAWREVSEVTGAGPGRGVAMTLGPKRRRLRLPPLRYANLSLLSRADSLAPGDLLVAVCRHYTEEGE